MYRLIIVDDEKIIREGLADYIAGENLGFEVMGIFEDGQYAIDFINNNEIEVCITDIRLIEVSGLELAKFIYDHYPKIKVVLLSGYKEFDYAKKGIEFNVENYLLKPADFDEIKDTLKCIKEKLDEEVKEGERVIHYEKLKTIVQEELFCDILMGAQTDEEKIIEKFKQLQLNIDYSNLHAFLVTVRVENYENYISEHWHYGRDKLHTAILNIIAENSNDVHFFQTDFRDDEMTLLAVMPNHTQSEVFNEKVRQSLDEAKSNIKDTLQLTLTETETHWFTQLSELINYNSAKKSGESERFDGDNENGIFDEQIQLIIYYISKKQLEEADNLLKSFVKSIGSLQHAAARYYANRMLTMLSDSFRETVKDISKLNIAARGCSKTMA